MIITLKPNGGALNGESTDRRTIIRPLKYVLRMTVAVKQRTAYTVYVSSHLGLLITFRKFLEKIFPIERGIRPLKRTSQTSRQETTLSIWNMELVNLPDW